MFSDSDPDFESGGGHASRRENSEDVGSGGQASKDDHISGGNHDFKDRPSEGGASEGNSTFDGDHDSESRTSEGRGDPTFKDGISESSGSERGLEANKGGASGDSQTSGESPISEARASEGESSGVRGSEVQVQRQ